MRSYKNIKKLNLELDKNYFLHDIQIKNKKYSADGKDITEIFKNNTFKYLLAPINLFLNDENYLNSNSYLSLDRLSNETMFFQSIPNKLEFNLYKRDKQSKIYMIDGLFDLILDFEDETKETVKVTIDFFMEDEPSYTSMKTSDLFQQFDQMWIDLVDVLYQVYPKEIVDSEMEKIYKDIDKRVAEGRV